MRDSANGNELRFDAHSNWKIIKVGLTGRKEGTARDRVLCGFSALSACLAARVQL